MTKEEIKKNFLEHVEESYRVGKAKNRSVMLFVKHKEFMLMSIWGVIVVPYDHPGAPVRDLKEVVLKDGRYFFNYNAAVDYAGAVAFSETPVEPVGYTFEQMLERVEYKRKYMKKLMIEGLPDDQPKPVQLNEEK